MEKLFFFLKIVHIDFTKKSSIKKHLFFILGIFCYQLSYGQSLTESETAKYIQKKMDEALNHVNHLNYRLIKSKISIYNCSFEYTHQFTNNGANYSLIEFNETIAFNPKHIIKIENKSASIGTIGTLRLFLVGKTAINKSYKTSYEEKSKVERVRIGSDRFGHPTFADQYKPYYRWEPNNHVTKSLDYVDIYFMQTDPMNYDKLRKAFEHLKTLCNLEDDPFG